MDEFPDYDDSRRIRREEIRNSTYREWYWQRRRYLPIGDGVVALLAGTGIGPRDGWTAALLGAILLFICLEAFWGAVFYLMKLSLRRKSK